MLSLDEQKTQKSFSAARWMPPHRIENISESSNKCFVEKIAFYFNRRVKIDVILLWFTQKESKEVQKTVSARSIIPFKFNW